MERRQVALLIETSNDYARGLLHGITDYIRKHEAWSVYLPEQERGAAPPPWLDRWKGDGIIARIENEQIAKAVKRSKLPTVDVSAARGLENVPWVETDDQAIAEIAANHLFERGFRHFGYCGVEGFNWSTWRQQNFTERIEATDAVCHVHNVPSRQQRGFSWSRERQRLRGWLKRLPKPIGILACYDIQAQQLLDACREENLAVPEEVAVVGVDNDELLCNLAMPPLTSVAPDSRRSGYESAALLDRMMAGEQVSDDAHLIKPLGIVTRQSTDVLAISDPDVATAARYIRERACQGINVNDVVRHVPLTRRVLEHRFQELLGRTPHAEIARYRLNRVKQLLTETDLPLAKVAERSGFRHVEYLTVAFKKQTGMPPSKYRKLHSTS